MKEAAWFDDRDMKQYAMYPEFTVFDPGNLLLLRSDIHKLFDAFKWVIYPKTFHDGATPETLLVFHLMKRSPQLRELYHEVPLRDTEGLCLEYLLSRFALAIFPRVEPFLRQQANRYLIQVKANARGGKSELVTRSDLAQDYRTPGARPNRPSSSSPSKRSRRESESPTKMQEMDTYDQSDMQTKSHGQGTKLGTTHGKRRRSSFEPIQATYGPDERAISTPPKRIQRNIFTTGLNDDPCTCPHHLKPLTPTSVDGSCKSVDVDDDPWRQFKVCRSQNCLTRLERDRFKTLRESALHDERAKSGTEEWWTGMKAWCQQTLERGGGISPRSIRKWMWIRGAEFEKEDGEEGELDFLRDESNSP